MGGPAQVQDQIRQDQVRKSDVSPVEQLHALIAADMAATDRLIHTRMTSGVALIPELARHLIDSGGKRLRPMLTLAAAQAGGYGGDHHVRLAIQSAADLAFIEQRRAALIQALNYYRLPMPYVVRTAAEAAFTYNRQ